MEISKGKRSAKHPAIRDETTLRTVNDVLTSIRDGYHFKAGFTEFFRKHTHHEVYSEDLMRECLLVCTASALVASCLACKGTTLISDLIAHLNDAAIRADKDAERGTNKAFFDLSCEEILKIRSYAAAFEYVYSKNSTRHKAGKPNVLSSLTTMGYMMIRSVLIANRPVHEEFGNTVHLLHDLVMPLLASTFENFSARSVRQKAPSAHAS